MTGLFFHFCLRLRELSFHLIESDGVVVFNDGKVLRSDSSDSDSVALITPLTSPIFYFY